MFISSVTTNLVSVRHPSIGSDTPCTTGEYPLTNGVNVLHVTVPRCHVLLASGTSITMTNEAYDQDDCQGQSVVLGFTSP